MRKKSNKIIWWIILVTIFLLSLSLISWTVVTKNREITKATINDLFCNKCNSNSAVINNDKLLCQNAGYTCSISGDCLSCTKSGGTKCSTAGGFCYYGSCSSGGYNSISNGDCSLDGYSSGYNCCGNCNSHSSYKCYGNDIWWYDSCGNRETIKESCTSCNSGDTTCGSSDCSVSNLLDCPSIGRTCQYQNTYVCTDTRQVGSQQYCFGDLLPCENLCSNGECPSADLCIGISCPDKCSGNVRYYNGQCSITTGECGYQTKTDNTCKTCDNIDFTDDYCVGTTLNYCNSAGTGFDHLDCKELGDNMICEDGACAPQGGAITCWYCHSDGTCKSREYGNSCESNGLWITQSECETENTACGGETNLCAEKNCNDLNKCTTDSCQEGQCFNTPITCPTVGQYCDGNTGSCTTSQTCKLNSECNDNNINTVDSCIKGKCVYVPISKCKSYQEKNTEGKCVFSFSKLFTADGFKSYWNDFMWWIIGIGSAIILIIVLLIVLLKPKNQGTF